MNGPSAPIPNAPGPADIVIDAGVAVAWAVPRFASSYTSDVQFAMIRKVATVPMNWLVEVAQALLGEERRGRLTSAQVTAKLTILAGYPITIDGQTATRSWGDTLTVARTHRISTSLAAYIELALRYALPLATADATLTRAAVAAGVTIYAP